MKRNTPFLTNYLVLSLAIIAIFGTVFWMESKRLEIEKDKIYGLSAQELSLTEHLFTVATSQGRMEQLIKKIIALQSEMKVPSGDLITKSHKKMIQAYYKDLSNELELNRNEYEKMKDFLVKNDSNYVISLLSIELYFNEIDFVGKAISESMIQFYNSEYDTSIDYLNKASQSLDKILHSYQNEISYISNNVQNIIVKGYHDIYESNMTVSLISGVIIVGFLVYTFFALVLPFHKIAENADQIIQNKSDQIDTSHAPAEIQKLLEDLKTISNKFNRIEVQLNEEKNEFKAYERSKTRYYQQLESELERPLEIINRTLHRIHDDKNISIQNKKLVELAENEYDHLKSMLIKANEVSFLEENSYKLNFLETNIHEFLSGQIASFRKNFNISKKFFIQMDPEIPNSIFLDQKHFSEVLQYALVTLATLNKGAYYTINAGEVIFHEQKFIYLDVGFERNEKISGLQENDRDKEREKDMEFVSTMAKHHLHSSEFQMYQHMTQAIGGTMDIKLIEDGHIEFRIMIPCLGENDLKMDTKSNENLVG